MYKRQTKSNIPASTARQVGAGHSTYLYPSTRQVLGPTYANTGTNVAGEMIKGMGIAYGLSSLMSGVTSVFRDASTYEDVYKRQAIHNEGGKIAKPGSPASYIRQRQFIGYSTTVADKISSYSIRIFDGFPK